MTWSEQAQSMTNLWTEAQKTMWQSWYNAMQTGTNPAMFGPNIIEEWRKLATSGMEMWGDGGGGDTVFKTVTNQLMASQAAMLQLLQFTTNAWQSMAPQLDAGGDWQGTMEKYVEQLRQQMMPNPQMFSQTATDTAQLWRTYIEQFQTMMQPWAGVARRSPGLISGAMSGNGSTEMLELTRMYWHAFDQTFGSVSSVPGLGFTREHEQNLAEGFEAWKKMQESYSEYQVLIADAWSNVFRDVLQELKDRSEQGKPIESMRDLMRLWINGADSSFDKLFRSDDYAKVQGQFVTDYMQYRIKEQEVFEAMMKNGYVPTRSEVDEAHRNIYELRKEVKALKKALGKKPAIESSAKPAPAPAPQGGEQQG